jgi:hypothetical protein
LPGNGRVGKDITLSIYPNPVTNGILNLTTETAMQHVKIYSIQGKLVYEQDLIGTEAQLRANLPAGTYTLLLSTETGAVHKLVSWE